MMKLICENSGRLLAGSFLAENFIIDVRLSSKYAFEQGFYRIAIVFYISVVYLWFCKTSMMDLFSKIAKKTFSR